MPDFDGSENFLELYMTAVGESEVPPQFHYWTALSLIAACLENRVWMERFAFKPVYPNQYTFLIGDSASGKGTAISVGSRILQEVERQGFGALNELRGALTKAGLQDEMTERWDRQWKVYEEDMLKDSSVKAPTGCSLYFTCPELSSSIGTGIVAKDIIKLLTEWWEGDIGSYKERTRTSGKHAFRNPCLNCLAGSTKEWCREVIDENDLRSGFWARVSCVMGERDFSKRIYMPEMEGWQAAAPLLGWRLSMLKSKVAKDDVDFMGRMFLSDEAREVDKAWYEQRPEPENDLLKAHWARQPDQVWRIAMLLRMADFYDLLAHPYDESWKIIYPHHIEQAQVLSDKLTQDAGIFMSQSLTYQHSRGAAHVEEILRKKYVIQQTPELLKMVSRFGVKAKDLEIILQGLEDEQKIERVTQGSGKYSIHWKGGAL